MAATTGGSPVKVAKIASVLALALGLAACANDGGSTSDGGSTADSSGPIKIGVIVPLSGPAGPNGRDVLNAITVQADLVNKAGGVLGRQLEIVSKDDQSTPAQGVSAATELAADGVSVVMGGWNSPVTLAIQPVLVRQNILNITTIPQNASILGGADPDAIRMNAGNAVGAYAAGQFLKNQLNATKVAFLLQNDAYGNDAGAQLQKQLTEQSVQVVAQQKFAYTDTDFRVPLSNVRSSGADAVFSANAAESSGMPALAKQYAEGRSGVPHFAGVGTVSPKVIDLAGGATVDGLYSADIYFPEAPSFAAIPENKAFVEAYQAAHNELPDKYRALGAQSVDIWAKAVAKAGTLERAKVADAIHGQSFTGTIFGDVRFTGDGQMEAKVYGFTVKGGKIEVLDEIPVPEAVWG
jgi:branched-chain amino acid transport system substrate-binding protein